jgi:hypothetical protein
VAKTKPTATATANNSRKAVKHWERPSYLDTWGPPKFQNERYLFREPDSRKHYDALIWAGNQIAFLMQAALDVLAEHGISEEEASEKLRLRLREARREEAGRTRSSRRPSMPAPSRRKASCRGKPPSVFPVK